MNEAKVLDVINQFKNTGKTFAEFIGEVFKDKLVEVYLGDSYEELSTEQVSIAYPSVICGKVVGSFRECLVLNCAYVENSNKLNKNAELKFGKMLFLHEYSIKSVNEVDGKSIFQDLQLRSKDSLTIKSLNEFIKSNG
jgi:hypothetical protein